MKHTINIIKLLEKQREIEKALRDMRNEGNKYTGYLSQEDVWAAQRLVETLNNLSRYYIKAKVGE